MPPRTRQYKHTHTEESVSDFTPSTDYSGNRMDDKYLMSTVPRELRELYYDVVVCSDLETEGTMKHASHPTSSRILDRTSLNYKADLQIPRVIGPVMTCEEQRIATEDAPGDYFTPMISPGNKTDLDRTRETY